eukprot:jgi/Chlat1/4101/Chrsp26S04146
MAEADAEFKELCKWRFIAAATWHAAAAVLALGAWRLATWQSILRTWLSLRHWGAAAAFLMSQLIALIAFRQAMTVLDQPAPRLRPLLVHAVKWPWLVLTAPPDSTKNAQDPLKAAGALYLQSLQRTLFVLGACCLSGVACIVLAIYMQTAHMSPALLASTATHGALLGAAYTYWYRQSGAHVLHFPIVQVVFTEDVAFTGATKQWPDNINGLLLEALASKQSPMLQHLALLDLCQVAELGSGRARREALFAETAWSTVEQACLQPINAFTKDLAEAVSVAFQVAKTGASSALSASNMSAPPSNLVLRFGEVPSIKDSVVAWSARAISSLVAASHQEDTYGIVQLQGSIAAVVTALTSSLLAIEDYYRAYQYATAPQLIDPVLEKSRAAVPKGMWGQARGLDKATGPRLPTGARPAFRPLKMLEDSFHAACHVLVDTFGEEISPARIFRPQLAPLRTNLVYGNFQEHVSKLTAFLRHAE